MTDTVDYLQPEPELRIINKSSTSTSCFVCYSYYVWFLRLDAMSKHGTSCLSAGTFKPHNFHVQIPGLLHTDLSTSTPCVSTIKCFLQGLPGLWSFKFYIWGLCSSLVEHCLRADVKHKYTQITVHRLHKKRPPHHLIAHNFSKCWPIFNFFHHWTPRWLRNELIIKDPITP